MILHFAINCGFPVFVYDRTFFFCTIHLDATSGKKREYISKLMAQDACNILLTFCLRGTSYSSYQGITKDMKWPSIQVGRVSQSPTDIWGNMSHHLALDLIVPIASFRLTSHFHRAQRRQATYGMLNTCHARYHFLPTPHTPYIQLTN